MHVKLKVILASGFSYDWSCQGATLSIGRDPDCDMTIEDSDERIVSWMHARIEADGDTARIRDFRSKNGTYVNEEPVEGTRPVQIGDTIRLGRKGPKLIVLELDTHRDDTPPVPPRVSAKSTVSAGLLRYFKERGFRGNRWVIGGGLAAAVLALLVLAGTASRSDRDIAQDPLPDQEKQKKTAHEVPPPPPPKNTANLVHPPPPPPRVLTPEELVKRYSGALVWLGVELDGRRWPQCSGFVVDRTKIVCTGREIARLKGCQQKGEPVFVYCEGSSPKFLRVVDLKVHPLYDEKNPMHDVGVAIVESPLPGSVDLLPWRELPSPPTGMEVTLGGYAIQFEPELKPYDSLDPPKPVWPRGRIRGTKMFPGGEEHPLLELEISAADGTEGGPVFSATGKVIGVLLRYGDQRYVVLSDQLSELIR